MLAAAIFPGTGNDELNEDQKKFVRMHIKLYKEYRKEVAATYFTMIKRRCNGVQYNEIFQMYKDRIALDSFKAGVRACVEIAVKRDTVIYGHGIFIPHIQHYHKKNLEWRNSEIRQLTGEEPEDPWFYDLWLEYRKPSRGHVFCPVYGLEKVETDEDESDSEEIDENAYLNFICAPKVDGRLVALKKKRELKEHAVRELQKDMPFYRQKLPELVPRYQEILKQYEKELNEIMSEISRIEGEVID